MSFWKFLWAKPCIRLNYVAQLMALLDSAFNVIVRPLEFVPTIFSDRPLTNVTERVNRITYHELIGNQKIVSKIPAVRKRSSC